MKIIQKRIRNIENYLSDLTANQTFHIAFVRENNTRNMQRVGFNEPYQHNTQILPSIVGKVSRFNSEGGFTIDRTRKEFFFLQREWCWKPFNSDERCKIVDIRRERFARNPIPAPSEELRLIRNGTDYIIISKRLTNNPRNYGNIKHIINLFLECFGECDTLNENLIPVLNAPIIRVNWRILPQGRPINIATDEIREIIRNAGQGYQPVIRYRLQNIINHNPNFIVIGNGGFKGYMIFGFPNRNFFLLESFYTGNATYVLGNNWEDISQLTKAEILNNNLHIDRIEHRETWPNRINRLF